MGDLIQKLPVDETLKLSVKDKNVIKTFFGVEDLPAAANVSTTTPSAYNYWFHLLKFSLIFTLLFYICSHPASLGKYVPESWRTVGTACMFFIGVLLYMYFVM